jgi:hypothetical protein
MKIGKEEQVETMLKEAKISVSIFDELVSNMNEEEINSYRDKINSIIK